MNAEQRLQTLKQLSTALARRRMQEPTRIVLDVLVPFGFIASQVALFVYPFTPLGRWRDYVSALDEEQGWRILQALVEDQASEKR